MFPVPFEHKVAMKTFEDNQNIRFSRIDGELVACDAITEIGVFLNMYKKCTKDFVIERKIPVVESFLPIDEKDEKEVDEIRELKSFLGFFHKTNPTIRLSIMSFEYSQADAENHLYFDSETLNFLEYERNEEEVIQHNWIKTQ